MPCLQKFCWCYSLKTGGVILGCIGVVFSFLALLHITIAFANNLVYQIFFGIYFAILLVAMISSSLLIVGAVRRNRYLLLPWLILVAIELGASLTYIMVQVSVLILRLGRGDFSSLFIILIIFGFGVYVWLVIMSLFQKLHEEDKSEVRATAIMHKAPPVQDGLPA